MPFWEVIDLYKFCAMQLSRLDSRIHQLLHNNAQVQVQFTAPMSLISELDSQSW